MERKADEIPMRKDGSADLMGVYELMFSRSSKKTRVKMVEGSLEVIAKLMSQPFFSDAIKRGVHVDILYTGPKPSSERERSLYQEIVNFNTPRIALNNDNMPEALEIISEDLKREYLQLGISGVTNHLMRAMKVDDHFMSYSEAQQIAIQFERYFQRQAA